MKKVKSAGLFVFVCMLSACGQSKYVVQSVESSRIEMDSAWDAKANPAMAALVASYKTQLDAKMNAPIGVAAQTLQKGFPQSLLSNFTADAMQQMAETEWGHVDFAVMNMGGLRSTLNQGPITLGNLYEVYPFENRLVLLELPGKAVKDFFDFIAFHGGQGLSGTVSLAVKKRAVESLNIGGKPLDERKVYRIATIDYLAEGNDGMVAFQQATKVEDSNRQLRDWMIEYVKTLTANNIEINATIDNRITIHN
ncbi:MAG: 5'-nucleotidase C-terminal domain-containing protein [Dysgonamonadaceae bacterium]|jgi:2',3'-cyclic-nucleotide 2'-phosphodiesterase (5'-nucleotidase family)|nr:5'-nucleotidase C-terminal domain-containing protein [Dysgonamonadaceae bacterium]